MSGNELYYTLLYCPCPLSRMKNSEASASSPIYSSSSSSVVIEEEEEEEIIKLKDAINIIETGQYCNHQSFYSFLCP